MRINTITSRSKSLLKINVFSKSNGYYCIARRRILKLVIGAGYELFNIMDPHIIDRMVKLTKLTEVEIQRLAAYGTNRKFPKKKKLAVPNRFIENAYFLNIGIVRHYIRKGNEEFTKNFIRGPRFMLPSLTGFFLEAPSVLYCEALTNLDVVEWKREDLYNFADKHPRMYKFLLQAVVKAFHSKEIKEIAFSQLDAKQRYLNFIDDYPNLINEIPNHYVASYLGVRPETLSRVRAQLNS